MPTDPLAAALSVQSAIATDIGHIKQMLRDCRTRDGEWLDDADTAWCEMADDVIGTLVAARNALRALATALEREREAHGETRAHAEALANEVGDWRRNHTECTDYSLPCGNETCEPDCPVARFRAANPKEK